jgi:glycosyltransferase involved in cell wall biosynthesis
MKSPLVSIIIPNFNRGNIISDTLDSVLSQTYDSWECIIVDDGSTDDSLKVIGEYVNRDFRFKFFSRPDGKKKGANGCRNLGVEKSKGDFLLFLDSDDVLKEECLQGRILSFEDNPDLDFVVFSMGLIKNSKFENYEYPDLSNVSREKLIALFITGPLPWNMTRPMWRKRFFCEQGRYNEELSSFDDDEFNLRVVYNKNVKFKFIYQTDCFYRIHEENSKKYKDEEFIGKLIRSHLILLKEINKVFNSEDKVKFRIALQDNIVGVMNGFLNNNYNNKFFLINIFYFYKNFKSSLSFIFFLFLKFSILKCFSNRKGSFRINKFLDSKLNV